MNFVDKQHYAVKRIPLSSKVIKRLHDDGYHGSDNILREIRTLAKLEHCNIVRYHNAWIETSHDSLLPLAAESRLAAPPGLRSGLSAPRKLITSNGLLRPLLAPVGSEANPPRPADEDGIVFGEDTSSSELHMPVEPASILTESDSAIPLPDSAIFTDGRSRDVTGANTNLDYESSYVLHVQMSIHPLTLTTYLSPPPRKAAPLSSIKRHCYHVVPSLRILLGIICGLQYLHALNIVHRDIKPGNILLSEFTGVVSPVAGFCDVGSCPSCPDASPYFLNPRIADFGLVAEIVDSGMGAGSMSKPVGTELYRPREQGNTGGVLHRVDPSLDVFALGIVLFEMLWRFETKMERQMVLDRLQEGQLPKDFTTRMDTESDGMGELVSRCILGMVDRRPESRWTCDQVSCHVNKLLHQLGCTQATSKGPW